MTTNEKVIPGETSNITVFINNANTVGFRHRIEQVDKDVFELVTSIDSFGSIDKTEYIFVANSQQLYDLQKLIESAIKKN